MYVFLFITRKNEKPMKRVMCILYRNRLNQTVGNYIVTVIIQNVSIEKNNYYRILSGRTVSDRVVCIVNDPLP